MRRERVRRWIDGELDSIEETKLLVEAERDPKLAALIEDAVHVREALGRVELPPIPSDLVDQAVLRAVQRRAREEDAPAWKRWLRGPYLVRVRVATLVAALGAALVAGAALEGWVLRSSPERPRPTATETAATTTAVRLVLPAEGARSVAIAGDFNAWNPESLFLEDPEGDGTFVGTVLLEPGSYSYMFVVDGEHWVTDPYAVNHRDDGFGHQNAVLRID